VRDHTYFVYILASKSRVLYTGITNSVVRRTLEHRDSSSFGFTQRYRVWRLVYYERHGYILNAIHREKQIKSWSRARKIALIEGTNPTWEDRSLEFGAKAELKSCSPRAFGTSNEQQIATSGSCPPRNDNKKE
jgi:putative endonuclease